MLTKFFLFLATRHYFFIFEKINISHRIECCLIISLITGTRISLRPKSNRCITVQVKKVLVSW